MPTDPTLEIEFPVMRYDITMPILKDESLLTA